MDKMLLDVPDHIESERLILRCYRPGDGPMYFAVGQKNREHLQRYEAENVILTARSEEEAEILVRELAAEWMACHQFFIGAFEKSSGEFVAQIYVGPVNWDLPELSIGYFVDKDHEGHGFVTEAVRVTLRFVFENLKAHRVRIESDDTNLRSCRVAERCGFVREAHFRANKLNPDGTFSGTFYYGLVRSDYEAQKRPQASRTPRTLDRPFQGESDFWKVRDLLLETYQLTPTYFNWDIRRWDGNFFHNEASPWNTVRIASIHLWETEEGKLVGAVHPEGKGDAYLELHPDFRHIEEEMIAWAEEHLAVPAEDGQHRRLFLYMQEYDSPRRRVLTKRGYEKLHEGWVVRRMRFGNRLLPGAVIVEGYTLRTTRPGDEDDYQRIAGVLNAGFGRTFHTASEYRNFVNFSPSFRHDLNLVAEAQDGSFAAHVGVTYDETNRRGNFEPVCTHPDHRRKGLARCLMFEGLHRLEALGATDVYVETGDDVPANELYESVGFTEAYQGYAWCKVF